MDIIQTFYDSLASHYDKLFLNWHETTKEQALLLDTLFRENRLDTTVQILDCACGIGTQAIGLASLGYVVTGSDISRAELDEAKKRAKEQGVTVSFECADFRKLSDIFSKPFDVVLAMDNALPHMLTEGDLELAVKSIADRTASGGMFVASIRDYDALLKEKPPYSPPYIHKTDKGQRVSFQTWDWNGDRYKLIQYIIEDEETQEIHKFTCEYRATKREELTKLLIANGFQSADWKFPEETGFYQPIVIARK